MYTFILFLFVTLFALFLLNFSIYFPVVKAYNMNRMKRLWLVFSLLLLMLIVILGVVANMFWNIYWLTELGFIWLGILSISLSVMLFNLPVLLIYRRAFRITTTISLVLIVILSVLALINNKKLPVVREYHIYSEKLTSESDGFRLVLVSEFHLTGSSSRQKLERNLRFLNSFEPDILIIAGDLIDSSYDEISHLASPFLLLQPTYGTLAVPGNHDFYQEIGSYQRFTESAEINNLYNRSTRITDEIVIAGVIDKTGQIQGAEDLQIPDVEKAMRDIDPESYTVFVSHQPVYIGEALDLGADLLLAGHTHGGQIPPLTALINLFFQYPYGLYERDGSYIYTTSGINTWGPPMRLFSRNEIVIFDLYSLE